MSLMQKIQIKGKPTLGKGDLNLILSFDPESLKITETPFGVVLDLEDAYLFGKPGTLGFPTQLLRVALPLFSDIIDMNVVVTKKVNVTQEPVLIAPIQEPQSGTPTKIGGKESIKNSLFRQRSNDITSPTHAHKVHGVTCPNLEEYKEILNNPAPVVRIASIDYLGIATVITLEVKPVRQNKDWILELSTEIHIMLTYESTTAPKTGGLFIGSHEFKQVRTKSEARLLTDILKSEVLNPDWIIDISDIILKDSTYDYLIITDNNQWDPVTMETTGSAGDLVTSFQKLVNWKKKRGLKAFIVTITDILQNKYGDFKTGSCDLQEVIRNFLKWAYSNWGILWLLLGGDVNIIPVRYIAGNFEGSIYLDYKEPPDENESYWTGSYLKMNVVSPCDGSGHWPPKLVSPYTGTLIPYDNDQTSSVLKAGWYYTTDNTYSIPTSTCTNFVRVNGPESLILWELRWLYQGNQIPTDLYYSSLIGPHYNTLGRHDWDINNNGIYGQHNNDADIDGVNYTADIHLGRAPVASVKEADAFVDKVIAYEQYRDPNGKILDIDWPRRLLIVSSSYNSGNVGVYIYPSVNEPSENNVYYHNTADSFSLIKMETTFADIKWHLFAVVTAGTDIRDILYNSAAENDGEGWYFAKSDTDLSISETIVSTSGIHIPIPTQWVVVYGNSDEIVPLYYVWDTNEDLSMTEQETLRKQLSSDFPGIDLVKRLYEDEIDLPTADATSPPVDHLTESKLRDAINLGQHFVSLRGHGSPNDFGTLLGNDMAQNATNGYHTSIVYADSCSTNNFEADDSISEDLLNNPNGGAVAYIGYTRSAFTDLGYPYESEFFKCLKSVRNLALLNDSRLKLPNNTLFDKWIKFSLNLLGDPEMPVWVGIPNVMNVTHPSEVLDTDQHVQVKVTSSSGKAIEGAVVSVSTNDWMFSTITDATGQADLNSNHPAKGSMEIVVTSQDYIPYFGKIDVATYFPPIVCNVIATNYKYQEWGQYPLINQLNIFGAKQVPLFSDGDQIWQSHIDKVAELVNDSNDTYNIGPEDTLNLGKGYSIWIQYDVEEEKKVLLVLDHNGQTVDVLGILAEGQSHEWNYASDVLGITNVPVLKAHVELISHVNGPVVHIDGLWLIDYVNATALNLGYQIKNYKLDTIHEGTGPSDLGSLVFEFNPETQSQVKLF